MTEVHAELELARDYAAGTLDPDRAEPFEAHLLTCRHCQDEVRLAVGVRQAVPRTRVAQTAGTKRVARFAIPAVVLIAATVVFVVIPRGNARRLAELGRLEQAPPYQALGVRALPGKGDSLFAEGMRVYGGKRYDDAGAELRAALAAGVDTIPATFFLASAQLMGGRPREAVDSYARIIAAGDAASAYLAEAHFYRAHALLALGRGDDALAELAAVGGESEHAVAAAALADRVKQVLKR